MASQILDAYLAPFMVPTIMFNNMIRQLKIEEPDLLYITVAMGTLLSSLYSLSQLRLNRMIRDRRYLTLLTALLMTTTSCLAIIGFHILRVNAGGQNYYHLPEWISTKAKEGSIFRYHFYADFIPGMIILSQTQACSIIKNTLLNKAKRKFTFGEASIVAQLTSSAYLTWALVIYTNFSSAGPFQVQLTTNIVLNLAVLIFATVFAPSYLLSRARKTWVKYSLICLFAALAYANIQRLISYTSPLDPATWLVDHIFATHQRLSLFSLWLSTLAACVSFSLSWTRMVGQTNSLVRKLFHLAMCCVFISGYNQDINFTKFAAGCIIVVTFLIEIIRAWQLKPLGKPLEEICRSLRGKWDNRYITVSHIYLLIGTFLPLWLLPLDPNNLSNKLILSSGLISVGVGDTAAAIVGTFFGRTKLSENSGKTLEGTLGNILAMLLFKLIWVGYADFNTELSFVIAAATTAATEATTTTCDNLILPLVMILLINVL